MGFQYYHYTPSLAAAILFAILFGLATLVHFYQMLRTRTWFLIPFLIGGVFETVGYIGRILNAEQAPGTYTLGPYIIQSLLLLVAPALFAASIYMCLGRIALMVRGDAALFVRRTWLTKLFVGGDVVSFATQAAGAGLLAIRNRDTIRTGQDIVIAGLILQVIFFGLFVLAAAVFHFRLVRRKDLIPLAAGRPWRKHMACLYAVSVLIFVRSIVRCVEYIQGYEGYIMEHEAFLYVFDATVMFAAVVVMAVVHPGEVAGFVRGMEKGKEERMEAGGL